MSELRSAYLGAALSLPRLIRQRVREGGAGLSAVRGAAGLVGAAVAVALLTLRFDAPLVVAALLGVSGLVYLLLRPSVATLVTLFMIYANIPVLAVRQFGVPTLVAASSVLLLGLPLAHYLLLERKRLRSDRTFMLMLLFLAVMATSALFAAAPQIAATRMRVYLLEGIALYWLIVNVVRDLPTFRRVVWTLLAAGALLGALGTWQAVSDSYGRRFGGLAHRQVEVLEADQGIDPETVHLRVSKRAEGPVDEPNRFAQILIVLLPLALYSYRCGTSRRARFAAALTGAFVLAGIFLTYSRGAFLILVALTAAVLWMRWLRPRHALALGVATALALPVIAPTYHQRIASIAGVRGLVENRAQARADGAIDGRATEMLASLNVFADHPLLGVGPGQYAPVYSVEYQNLPGVSFRDINQTRRAHSLYLELAAELGIAGLAVFLTMVGLLLRDLVRTGKRAESRELAELSTALALGLATYLGTALFLHLSFERYFWLLLALTSAALHLVRESVAAAEGGSGAGFAPFPVLPHLGRPPRPRFGRKRLATGVAAVVSQERRKLWTQAEAVVERTACRLEAKIQALRPPLASLIEELRSRFVFRALDAALTASVTTRAAAPQQIVFPMRRSHYQRVQAIAKCLYALWPGVTPLIRKALIRGHLLPFAGYRAPEPLGYGAACTVYRLPRRAGQSGASRDAVLKVVRGTLGRSTRNAVSAARAAHAAYQHVSRLYEGADLIPPTNFLVMHAPLLGRPGAVALQPRLPGSARDLFTDFSDRELLSILRTDAQFANQLRFFVARTSEALSKTGRCLDLVGPGNVLVVATRKGPRMRIIDFGEICLGEWSQTRPKAARDLQRRLARMDRLCRVPKGAGPRVEMPLWPR